MILNGDNNEEEANYTLSLKSLISLSKLSQKELLFHQCAGNLRMNFGRKETQTYKNVNASFLGLLSEPSQNRISFSGPEEDT